MLQDIRKITSAIPAPTKYKCNYSSAKYQSEQCWQRELPNVRLSPGLHLPQRIPEWLKTHWESVLLITIVAVVNCKRAVLVK